MNFPGAYASNGLFSACASSQQCPLPPVMLSVFFVVLNFAVPSSQLLTTALPEAGTSAFRVSFFGWSAQGHGEAQRRRKSRHILHQQEMTFGVEPLTRPHTAPGPFCSFEL